MTTRRTMALFFALALFSAAAGAHSYKNCPQIWWKTSKEDGYLTIWGGTRSGARGNLSVLYITATKKRRQLDATAAYLDRNGRFKALLVFDVRRRFQFRFECA